MRFFNVLISYFAQADQIAISGEGSFVGITKKIITRMGETISRQWRAPLNLFGPVYASVPMKVRRWGASADEHEMTL